VSKALAREEVPGVERSESRLFPGDLSCA